MSCARFGTVDLEQLFAGEAEGVLLVHRRHIVEAVEIADRLQVGLVLDQLFGAAVQQADVRIDAGHHLPVELEHQAQHAVGGRMLRTEIDVELADVGLWHCYCFAFSSPGSRYCGPLPRAQEVERAELLGSRTGS